MRLAAVPLPCSVTLPCATFAPEVIVPVVAMMVEPPIVEDPLIVAAVSVLLVRVDAPASVTITPDVGNVAVELTPVPPLVLLS